MASWITGLLSSTLTLLLCPILLYLTINSLKKKHKMSSLLGDNNTDPSKHALPPGPKGLPIIGNLHMLGDLPHQDLHKLSQKYGPIMHIRLGLITTIVVSSPEAAELFLKTHDLVFASRPIIQAAKYMSYGQKGIVFSQYGSYWRNIRKLCTLELFTSSKIEMLRPMRREEVSNLVEILKVAADAREVVCLSEMVGKVVEDMTYRMVFGYKDDRLNLKSIIDEGMELTGAFNIGDYVPFLAPFDLQGLVRRMNARRKMVDELLETIIEEHIENANKQQEQLKDFVDVMLSLMESNYMQHVKFDHQHIKSILLDVLAAGMDTSVNVLNWAFPELLRHPKVMNRVQEELKQVVGMDRMVEEIDLPKLSYLNIVIKEIFRLHPVAPLLVPHESIEEIVINEYYIPKKSRILVNIWAMGRDPNVWSEDAEEFNPDRFINLDIDIYGRDFQLIPFGSGRRGCPGMQLGLVVVKFTLAQLLHCFNWKVPDGVSPTDLDMTEKYGLTVSRASPLFTIPTYRLNV